MIPPSTVVPRRRNRAWRSDVHCSGAAAKARDQRTSYIATRSRRRRSGSSLRSITSTLSSFSEQPGRIYSMVTMWKLIPCPLALNSGFIDLAEWHGGDGVGETVPTRGAGVLHANSLKVPHRGLLT